ncbi:MAG TPA: hypothetical protein VK541_21095 [Pedobacter sp.]|uniref:hypothetical protein n=1 Tax=Pedobacter sp. TaxID=1411316 RepID=UPI002B5FD448|nr:hypothetical protein [Pedobacter sp.]HMI04996.1 hypothetical protein [Pedobacter sp.]
MTKNILIALLLIIALGCKKNKFSDDDTNLYNWKRDLYRSSVEKEKPAMFYSREGKIETNQNAIFVSSDFVVLTEYRKDKQQDSIFKASGKMLVYKYEKLERVEE